MSESDDGIDSEEAALSAVRVLAGALRPRARVDRTDEGGITVHWEDGADRRGALLVFMGGETYAVATCDGTESSYYSTSTTERAASLPPPASLLDVFRRVPGPAATVRPVNDTGIGVAAGHSGQHLRDLRFYREGGGVVAVAETTGIAVDGRHEALQHLTPDQAREVAESLHALADEADWHQPDDDPDAGGYSWVTRWPALAWVGAFWGWPW